MPAVNDRVVFGHLNFGVVMANLRPANDKSDGMAVIATDADMSPSKFRVATQSSVVVATDTLIKSVAKFKVQDLAMEMKWMGLSAEDIAKVLMDVANSIKE